jgi:putative transposase
MLLAKEYPRYGFGKMFNKLKLSGHKWNHKKVYRAYCELKLALRIKRRKRLPNRSPEILAQPISPNICWSIDFMSDSLRNGRKFRTFNVIDDFNRECLGIKADYSISSKKVVLFLEDICNQKGYPKKIRLDNGPEMISKNLKHWSFKNNILLDFIEPGTPSQNAYIERFNRTFREEVLDLYSFRDLAEIALVIDSWIEDYNYGRPHESLNNFSPIGFLCSYERSKFAVDLMDNAKALPTTPQIQL